MCEGIPIFADNEKALFGVGTNSHSTAAKMLGINEDNYRKFEYHWWNKTLIADYYDDVAEQILAHIDKKKALRQAKKLVKNKLSKQYQIVAWLKKTPQEWGRLMQPEYRLLAKKVNPKLLFYEKKLKNFKVSNKTNPYRATKLPPLKEIKKKIPKKVWAQVGDHVWAQVKDQMRDQVWDLVWVQVRVQVRDQVSAQMWDQVRDQMRNRVWDQVWVQVRDQVSAQMWDQVRDQTGAKVGDQVWDQVTEQVWATSYWAVKCILRLPIKHWYFDFLKLGVMIVFVDGKIKIFGKKGKYLGEYEISSLLRS